MADMIMPVVRKMATSAQALLLESKLCELRREITVGSGDRK